LDFYIEEYGTINLAKHVIFVEVKRNKGQWVFQLEHDDPSYFDEGASDFSSHRQIYSLPAPEKGFFSQYFKYHNNTNKEYSDLQQPALTEGPESKAYPDSRGSLKAAGD
jgi:hypothetical protein